MDEANAASAIAIAKIYVAVKRGGMNTFITKDPTSADAQEYTKRNAIDAWNSQPFSMPLHKRNATSKIQYWAYPNHNAGEIKSREVMQRGGRITYGFGMWRSGYNMLMPWHWNWIPGKTHQFAYLEQARSTGTGNRLDQEGNSIPAVYWECFREGRDDLRYIFTLRQTMFEREHLKDASTRALVSEGKALLRLLWNKIPSKRKYLSASFFNDKDFKAYRWQMAVLTMKLQKVKGKPRGLAPSVMTEASSVNKANDLTSISNAGFVTSKNLMSGGDGPWRSATKEATVKQGGNEHGAVLDFTVNVNHEIDGGGEKGKYIIGWPRIWKSFHCHPMALEKLKYCR